VNLPKNLLRVVGMACRLHRCCLQTLFGITPLKSPSRQLDAVGTAIADRPPHRTVRAPLCIRIPPRMSGGETFHRVWMQNTGYWNRARKERF